MGDLKAWADDQSEFIKLGDGDSVIGVFVGFEQIPNRFDPKKQSIRYTLEVEGTNGKASEKFFESGSANVARQFDAVEAGDLVKISRTGEGTSTKYEIVSVADKEGEVSKKEADKISKEMAG